MVKISVALATYNPRIDYLRRVIEGLRNQDFPLDEWEFLIIDNNSVSEFQKDIDTSWQPSYCFFSEPKQGLAQVRRRSFEEAKGQLIVLLDDDLILANDYLKQAWKIYERLPFLGIFGTQLSPEFEVPPTLKIHHYLNAERKINRSVWSNNIDDYTSTPWGAGMCVRSDLAQKYLKVLYSEPFRLELGRKGNKRLSCEDMDIAFFTCQMGLGKGMFRELNAVHLVPKAKMEVKHLVDTFYWNVYSYSIQNYFLFNRRPLIEKTIFQSLLKKIRNMRKEKIERLFEASRDRATKDALQDLRTGLFKF